MINGKTKVFGLIANPVEHTISPVIHQMIYDETGYNGTYNPYFVPKGHLEEAIKAMKALSIEGLNVSVPYKVDVMDYLDHVDITAKVIGACNTIVWDKERLIGYNTDWIGLKAACDLEGIPISDQDIVILGSGGSARAVAYMCQHEKASTITILNRTVSKAEEIASLIHDIHPNMMIYTGSLNDLHLVNKGAVVFQTTSVGMHPHLDQSPIDNDLFFDKVDFIVDIIYNPKETVFIKKGIRHGAKTMNGLSMLFFQAVKAFELWTHMELSNEQSSRLLMELENLVYKEKRLS